MHLHLQQKKSLYIILPGVHMPCFISALLILLYKSNAFTSTTPFFAYLSKIILHFHVFLFLWWTNICICIVENKVCIFWCLSSLLFWFLLSFLQLKILLLYILLCCTMVEMGCIFVAAFTRVYCIFMIQFQIPVYALLSSIPTSVDPCVVKYFSKLPCFSTFYHFLNW